MMGRDRRPESRRTGGTIWLTGLPEAGKSTIAQATALRLADERIEALVLDGDVLRETTSADLGFDPESRRIQAGRAAQAAIDAARAGQAAIVALVSPFADARLAARRQHDHAGLPFLEVHVATSATTCRARDPKGLWARAARGELTGLTGFDAPYEPPTSPEIRIVDDEPVDRATQRVVTAYHVALRASAGSRGRNRPDRRAAV